MSKRTKRHTPHQHLTPENHPAHRPYHHKLAMGACLMGSGSALAMAAGSWGLPHALHVAVDSLAYCLHGLGTVPVVEPMIKRLGLA